jgi:ferric-dicitrate binding protein FerR (iron transport regulator)
MAERRGTRRTHTSRAIRWIAGVSLGAVVGVLALMTIARGRIGPSDVAGPVRTYATVAGQTAAVTLRDGSRMLLGPATTVRVTATRRGATVADVSGEAFFTVTHRSDAPFLVRVGAVETRVLGTAFDVRRYATDGRTRIVVTEGRVAVGHTTRSGASRPTVLSARMMADVSDSGDVRVVPNVAIEDATGWIQGRVRFHGTPLKQVLADLGRVYDADMRVTDSLLAAQPITLSASVANDPLPAVMDFLARAADAHWVRDGRAFVLIPGRTPRMSHPSRFLKPTKQYGR